jgi:hypothetical protein
MEPSEPRRIDSKAAREALDAVGAKLECPSCDATDWRNLGDLGNAGVWLGAIDENGQPLQGDGLSMGIPAFAFTCANCGFIRLHKVDDLLKPEDETP